MTTKVFFDTEFTGLHQGATMISLGMVAETGETFYAEFTDYDKDQVDAWIRDHVLPNLGLNAGDAFGARGSLHACGDSETISGYIRIWLEQFEAVEMWGDCLAWDWVLFCELFGGAFSIPANIYYIPFDISTILKMKEMDPDVNREELAQLATTSTGAYSKHNALGDALVIRACYEKLVQAS